MEYDIDEALENLNGGNGVFVSMKYGNVSGCFTKESKCYIYNENASFCFGVEDVATVSGNTIILKD